MTLDSVTEYALSFSGEAVHLQSRRRPTADRLGARQPAWRHLGSVDFDEPQFRDALRGLRRMATGAPDDVALPVTLIIPDDQILYTTLTVVPSADRESAVGRALDGLTPYPIDQLAFDWDGDGDTVRVAAVARQTLREACDFAAQYGFRGQGYCADPQEGQFPNEPIFVLDPPARGPLRVNPAAAAVTAPALMIEADEATGDTAGDDADPLPGGEYELPGDVSSREEACGADPGLAAVPDVATVPEVQAAPTPEPEPGPGPGPETVKLKPEIAEPKAQPDPAPQEAGTDEPVALPVPVAVPDSDPAPAHDAAKTAEVAAKTTPGGDVPKAAPAAPVPDAKAVPVVRHAPARPTVAAPPRPQPSSAGKISPRAQAMHERAAEARQVRSAAAPAVSAGARPVVNHRGGINGLLIMLGLLMAGLVVIWSFAAPGDRPVQVVTSAEPEPPAQQPQPTADAASGQGAVQQPVPEAPAPQAEAARPQPTATAPAPEVQPEEEVGDDSAVPQLRGSEPDPVPPISALTQDEQRRVIVAAAAVAAAVVPPPQARAAGMPPADVAVDVLAAPASAADPAAPLRAASAPAPAAVQPRAQAAVPRVQAGNVAPVSSSRPNAARPQRAAANAPTVDEARLTSSARPQLAPRRATPRTSVPRVDTAPVLPSAPPPLSASSSGVPKASARPPQRPRDRSALPQPAAATRLAAGQPVAAQAAPRAVPTGAARPPQRPEGAAPEPAVQPGVAGDDLALLTPEERNQLAALIRDMDRHGLTLPRAVFPRVAMPADPASRLADARPLRKPGHHGAAASASDAVTSSAVEAALRSANAPPGKQATGAADRTPARDSGGLLHGSARPSARPADRATASAPARGVSEKAVEAAIASAVTTSPATPGGVGLAALRSSPLPPRRVEDGPAPATSTARPAIPESKPETPASKPAAPAATPLAPVAAVPAAPSPSEAEMAARRALDEQLQAQAEARIRARAQADAAAEAQARAQAEARARAQAAAEERAARASNRSYKPPEVDDEPDVAGGAVRGGVTTASVAKAATQRRGMDMGRTTIIGIIGAGQASRALIRLRSGKVVTVRLGDRIDGGTINSIGDGRLTYVKGGQVRELRLLDGR
ncbi:MAG: hypothetical protein QM682_08040 [Paracoccus sp. (in: a-proteobacteria)]|uniref:hypothetical protein n=1 Tax=Paracoccus sp. TaxID=267 RepID=UPI0039E32483